MVGGRWGREGEGGEGKAGNGTRKKHKGHRIYYHKVLQKVKNMGNREANDPTSQQKEKAAGLGINGNNAQCKNVGKVSQIQATQWG